MSPVAKLRQRILERLAWIHLHVDRQFGQAIECYLQALKLDADSSDDTASLGSSYFQNGDYAAAVDYLNRAQRLKASPWTAYRLLLAKGYLAEKQGDRKAAITLFENALRERKSDTELHYKLGNLYFDGGDYQKAYDHFQKVIDLRPDVANAYFYAGRAVQSLGRKDLAVNYFSKFLSLGADEQKLNWVRQHIPALSRQESRP
jgi:tetratricopeptide (TPR) repeat protein